jgi:citrate lyase beta subunit
MRIFHFIKYDENTSLDNLIASAIRESTLCFDFEDSIQDCLNPSNTSALKAHYRNCFQTLLKNSKSDFSKIKFGVRINAVDSDEYLKDINSLIGIKNISTIFLSKTNTPGEILDLQKKLDEKNIGHDELLPVIETKTGMNNLATILKLKLPKIRSIAFGHCDYNADNGIYPFFHQDSREYWIWVTKMVELIKNYNLSFVNSPFLQLNNDSFFKEMLSILNSICGPDFGQITLTNKQSQLCNSFSADVSKKHIHKLPHTLNLKVSQLFPSNFIETFKKGKNSRGFSINEDRIILSPHEYFSSVNYQDKNEFPEINFTFVGGCFPVQGDILFENLFHQLMKRKIEKKRKVKFNVNIIRYERLGSCIDKIDAYRKTNQIDVLAFSVRPEPFLRLVKLYYKFLHNSKEKITWSLNLPVLNKSNSEKHDSLYLDTRFDPTPMSDRSLFKKLMLNLNYISGSFIGNHNFAAKEYLKLLNGLKNYCETNNIHFILMGPPIRTNVKMEKLLSKKLDGVIKNSLPVSLENFVNGSDLAKNGKSLFHKNGITANEYYHELIAEGMSEIILKNIDEIAPAKISSSANY